MPETWNVVLAVDDTRLRERLVALFKGSGLNPQILSASRDLLVMASPSLPVILETCDDAAAFTQIVYELHRQGWKVGTLLPVVGIFSKNAARRNPALNSFSIDGNAAVAAIIPPGKREMDDALLEFIRRISEKIETYAG